MRVSYASNALLCALRVETASLVMKRLPFGWVFVLTDASGNITMLPVPDEGIAELRGFLQDACTAVD